MANASRDENFVPTLLGTLSTDGLTPIPIKANPTSHRLLINDGTTGIDHGRTVARRDENNIPVLLAVSSADYKTPVEVYASAAGVLLVDST